MHKAALIASVMILGLVCGQAQAQMELRLPVNKATERRTLKLDGKLYYRLDRNVKCGHDGTISEVFHEPGEMVAKNTVLARIALTAAEIDQLQQKMLNTEIENKKLDIASLDDRIAQAQDELDHLAPLHNDNLIPKSVFEASRKSLNLLRKRKAIETEALELMKRNYKQELQDIADDLGLDKLSQDDNPRYAQVRAPYSGKIVQSYLKEGRSVLEKTSCVHVAKTSDIVARVEVYQDELANLRVGDKVVVKLKQNVTMLYKAELRNLPVVPKKDSPASEPVYEVEFSIANPDAKLKEGYTVTVLVKDK